jgi:hypothetical protein
VWKDYGKATLSDITSGYESQGLSDQRPSTMELTARPTPWIHEPESGRYYVLWDAGYGQTIRRYSDELYGSFNAPLKCIQPDQNPLFIHEPETGRYYINWDDGSGRTIRRYSEEFDSIFNDPLKYTQPRRENHSKFSNDAFLHEEYSPRGYVKEGHDNGSRMPRQAPPTTNIQETSINTGRYDNLEDDYEFIGENQTDEKTEIHGLGGGDNAELDSGMGTVVKQGFSLLTCSDFETVVRPSRFFKTGRVFKVLWTEPAGAATAADPDKSTFLSEVGFGQMSFTKFRRFIVVRERLHSCLCLPIYTYGGQGAAKPSVRPQDHAVVYVDGGPQPLPPENEMPGKEAIPIILEHQTETLEPMSRIDFSRVYTVEHNVRVLTIGRISPKHLGSFDKAFIESTFGSKINSSVSNPLPVRSAADDDLQIVHMYSPAQDLWWRCGAKYGSGLGRNLISSKIVTRMGLISETDFATQCVSFNGLKLTFNSHVKVKWREEDSALSCLSSFSVVNQMTFDVLFDSELQSSNASVLVQSRPAEDARAQTPLKTTHIPKGNTESLDHRFRVERDNFFRVGRVFSTEWSEPYTGPTGYYDYSHRTRPHITFGRYNGRVYGGVRTFVVVRVGDKSCTCLPVNTYAGRGASEKDINLDEHCAIYSKKKPRTAPGMYKKALKITVTRIRETIEEESLVNLGRVYTVETSSKVKDVGDLESESKTLLLTYFQEVFFGVNKIQPRQPYVEAENGKAVSPDPGFNNAATSSFSRSDCNTYQAHQPRESCYNYLLAEKRPRPAAPITAGMSNLSVSAQPFTPFQSAEGVPSINPIVGAQSSYSDSAPTVVATSRIPGYASHHRPWRALESISLGQMEADSDLVRKSTQPNAPPLASNFEKLSALAAETYLAGIRSINPPQHWISQRVNPAQSPAHFSGAIETYLNEDVASERIAIGLSLSKIELQEFKK